MEDITMHTQPFPTRPSTGEPQAQAPTNQEISNTHPDQHRSDETSASAVAGESPDTDLDMQRERTLSIHRTEDEERLISERLAEYRRHRHQLHRTRRSAPIDSSWPKGQLGPEVTCHRPVCGDLTRQQSADIAKARQAPCTLEDPADRARCYLHGGPEAQRIVYASRLLDL